MIDEIDLRVEEALPMTDTDISSIRSPSIQKKIIEHKIDMEEKEEDHTWKSCCIELDRRAVQYFSQLFICVGIMTFCLVQLVRLDSCDDQQSYLGLLTLLIGIMIPSPKFNKK